MTSLPHEPATATHMSTITPPLNRDHPGSVLIVEQDPAVRDSCRETLEEAGYTVLVAAD